jgi:hypothetical protein
MKKLLFWSFIVGMSSGILSSLHETRTTSYPSSGMLWDTTIAKQIVCEPKTLDGDLLAGHMYKLSFDVKVVE